MIVKITSKRDTLALVETEEGIVIKPNRFDPAGLAPLRGRIRPDLPKSDFEAVRLYEVEPETEIFLSLGELAKPMSHFSR